jgi:hypothetical protein
MADRYPHGLIVNSERNPSARYLKLHSAACSHIKAWVDRNPTSTTYIKVCSPDLETLEEWARTTTGGGVLDPCPTCRPNEVACRPRFQAPESSALTCSVHQPVAGQKLLGRFAAAVDELDCHFARNPERLADPNVNAELRRWLEGTGPPVDWAGQEVTADEWFFITTLYGQRTRNQQRSLIRHHFPRFVNQAQRDMRNLTPSVTQDWALDQEWMKPRLFRMGRILRDRGIMMQGYVDHLRMIVEKATPEDPMPALDAIVRDHQATGWKTLSVFVRDYVGDNCFPIDSRVRKELERHRLPSKHQKRAALGQPFTRHWPQPKADRSDVL